MIKDFKMTDTEQQTHSHKLENVYKTPQISLFGSSEHVLLRVSGTRAETRFWALKLDKHILLLNVTRDNRIFFRRDGPNFY